MHLAVLSPNSPKTSLAGKWGRPTQKEQANERTNERTNERIPKEMKQRQLKLFAMLTNSPSALGPGDMTSS